MNQLPDPRERPWLTVVELAQITGEGEKAIRGAVARGELPVLYVGRYVRIPTAALLHQLGIAVVDNNEPAEPIDAPALAHLHAVERTTGPPAA